MTIHNIILSQVSTSWSRSTRVQHDPWRSWRCQILWCWRIGWTNPRVARSKDVWFFHYFSWLTHTFHKSSECTSISSNEGRSVEQGNWAKRQVKPLWWLSYCGRTCVFWAWNWLKTAVFWHEHFRFAFRMKKICSRLTVHFIPMLRLLNCRLPIQNFSSELVYNLQKDAWYMDHQVCSLSNHFMEQIALPWLPEARVLWSDERRSASGRNHLQKSFSRFRIWASLLVG